MEVHGDNEGVAMICWKEGYKLMTEIGYENRKGVCQDSESLVLMLLKQINR